jgi:hypothetical protein
MKAGDFNHQSLSQLSHLSDQHQNSMRIRVEIIAHARTISTFHHVVKDPVQRKAAHN